ncbi:hypothetical protein PENSPDRAFT_737815 [Peniophora sp. CONT]|nr:hypothetical protein PENSPDRAFT_737815 [Peniophora sp. CONT]
MIGTPAPIDIPGPPRTRTRSMSQPPKNRPLSVAVAQMEGGPSNGRRPSSSGGGLMARSSSLLQSAGRTGSRLALRKRTTSTSTPLTAGSSPVVAVPARPVKSPLRGEMGVVPHVGASAPSAAVTSDSTPSTPITPSLMQPTPRAPSTGPFADFMPLRKRASTKQRRASTQIAAPSPPPPVPTSPVVKGKGKDKEQAVVTVAGPEFSTADRTILEELRRGLSARSSQFVFKHGRRHHAYASTAAPYPRNYERDVVDHDVWETLFTRQLSNSLTFHVFDSPPTKVLDLGCGTGAWILECAKVWRETEFVGLDLVPLHPDVRGELGSRIRWIQDNALDGLPFPNDEFDFVHVKRLARGVPEDRWDFLLDEIARVMRPGGALEILEEDLFFPGQPSESSPPPSPAPSSAAYTSSTSSLPSPPQPLLPAPPASSPPTSTSLSSLLPSPLSLKRRAPSLPPQKRASSTALERATTLDAPELPFFFGAPGALPMMFAATPELAIPPTRKTAVSTTSAPSHAHTHSSPASPAIPSGTLQANGVVTDQRAPTKRPSFIRSLSSPATKRGPQAPEEKSLETGAVESAGAGLVRKASAVLLRKSGESEVEKDKDKDGTGAEEGKGDALGVRIPSATLFGPDDTSADGLLSPESENGLQPSPSALHPSSQRNSILRTTPPSNTHRHSSNASLSSVLSYASHDGLPSLHRTTSKLRVPDTPRASSSTDLASQSNINNSGLPPSGLGSSYGLIPLLPSDREGSQRNSVSGLIGIGGAGGGAGKEDVGRKMGVQDPRDHSVLEHIYAEMHAEKFINLAPLSLLANSLPLYFKDVRTHPPITFMFPPRPTSPTVPAPRASADESESDFDFPDFPGFTSSDTDDDDYNHYHPRGRDAGDGTLRRKMNGHDQLTMRASRKTTMVKDDARPRTADARPMSSSSDARPMSSWADHGHGSHHHGHSLSQTLSGAPTSYNGHLHSHPHPPPPNTTSHIRQIHHPHPRALPPPTSPLPQPPSSATPTNSAFAPHPPVPPNPIQRTSSPEGAVVRGREIWAQTQPFVVLDSHAPGAVPSPSARRASQSPGVVRKASQSPGQGLGRKSSQGKERQSAGVGRSVERRMSAVRRTGLDGRDEVIGRASTSSEASTASRSTTTATVTGASATPRTSFASEIEGPTNAKISFPASSASAPGLAQSNSFSSSVSSSTTSSSVSPFPPSTPLVPGIETSAPGTGASAGLNVNRLPNKTLSFDLQSLNLHLSIRVSELAACREAMWEWLVRWQEKERVGGGSGGGWIEEELRGMSRLEFEGLIARFEMDMQDSIALDARLAGTFAWPRPSSIARTPERKQFDAACVKWAEHARALPLESPERAGERSRMGPRMSRTIRVFCAWK